MKKLMLGLVALVVTTTIVLSQALDDSWLPYASDASAHFKENQKLLDELAREIRSDPYVEVVSRNGGNISLRRSFNEKMSNGSQQDKKRYLHLLTSKPSINAVSLIDDTVGIELSTKDIGGYNFSWRFAQYGKEYGKDNTINLCPEKMERDCGQCAIKAWNMSKPSNNPLHFTLMRPTSAIGLLSINWRLCMIRVLASLQTITKPCTGMKNRQNKDIGVLKTA